MTSYQDPFTLLPPPADDEDDNDVASATRSVQRLLMVHNKLTVVPAETSMFRNVRVLDISFNEIGALPPVVLTELAALEELHCVGNQLTELPALLARCTRLRKICASNNRIAVIDVLVWNGSGLLELDVRYVSCVYTLDRGAHR